jgi:tetratricopeptide (TPR) repeat protein
MSFWMALVVGATAFAAPVQQPVDAQEQSRTERAEHIADLLVAKQTEEAATLIDPLLGDYEKTYAGEKRRLYCADDGGESAALKPPADAVLIGKGWCRALWAKGYILTDVGRPADAIPYLKRALALWPGHEQYYLELGFAYQATRDWPAMLDAATQAAAAVREADGENRIPFLCKAWHAMAYAQIELGRSDDAIVVLNKCLALDPDNAKAKNELNYIEKTRAKG